MELPPGGYIGGRAKDPSQLSHKPSQSRIRIRRAGKKIAAAKTDEKKDYLIARVKEDLEILYQKPVEEWTMEELARGKPGPPNGKPPAWITPVIVREAKRRLMSETFGLLSTHVSAAVKTIYKLMMSEEVDDKGRPIVDPRTRLAAAQFIIENVIGKPKAILELEATDFTRQALAAAIVLDDGEVQDEPFIFDGQVIEEEEVDDDGDGDEHDDEP